MKTRSIFYALLATMVVFGAIGCTTPEEESTPFLGDTEQPADPEPDPEPEPEPEPEPDPELYAEFMPMVIYGYSSGTTNYELGLNAFVTPSGLEGGIILYIYTTTEGRIIPEGVYELNAPNEGLNPSNSSFGAWNVAEGEKSFFYFEEASLEVQHIENEYRFIFNAVDDAGVIYDVDWTGEIESPLDNLRILNPGEVYVEDTSVVFEESYIYGYAYGNGNYSVFLNNFVLPSGEIVEIELDVYSPYSVRVIPEGVYSFDTYNYYLSQENTSATVLGEGGKEDEDRVLNEATFEVQHIGNQYRFVFNAVDEKGMRYQMDWTGTLDGSEGDYKLFHPEEFGAWFDSLSVDGCCWNGGFEMSLGFFRNITDTGLVVDLRLEANATENIIPEGVYELGNTAPCIDESFQFFCARFASGDRYANLVDARMEVEHVDGKYHLLFYAVDENGAVYEADWTGEIKDRYGDGSHILSPGAI